MKTANDLINKILDNIVNPIIWLMFGAAFIVFLWGVTEYVLHLDDEKARDTGRLHMIWGIIGAAIMLSAIGIKSLIETTALGL
jgi:hypothetical protein